MLPTRLPMAETPFEQDINQAAGGIANFAAGGAGGGIGGAVVGTEAPPGVGVEEPTGDIIP